MNLFFNYSIDCELPVKTQYTGHTERCPFLGGPVSWKAAEESVRGFVERMADLGVRAGTTLFVYPDVAREQKSLYREMADEGVEIGLHLNGMRYSRLTGDKAKWLGSMTRDEQREALRMGKADLEQVIGRPCLGYRACYGSANDDTFPICEELGFEWASNPSSRCRLDTFANWAGSWPYPHFTNRKCKLVPGCMRLFEIPVTCGLCTFFENDPAKPFDLRVETDLKMLGENREIPRRIVEENILEMEKRRIPVRAIIGGSHNTNPFGDRGTFQSQNLDWVVKHVRELAARHRLEVMPASFAAMADEARRVDSY